MSRKGNLASRSLAYTPPETPAFLRALQAQVSAPTHRSASRDELESLIGSSSRSGKRKATLEQEEELDSDDEINGAQVVVLKDGKHLSHQQALLVRKEEKLATSTSPTVEMSRGKSQDIAQSSLGIAKKRRNRIDTEDMSQRRTDASVTNLLDTRNDPSATDTKKGASNLDDVKQLIRQERSQTQTSPQQPKEKTIRQSKKDKTAKARKLIARSGKGLSFDLDE